MEGGGPLRAALAGLAAVAILLAVFLWLSLDATLTSRSEEAGTQAARARALSIARLLESGGATVEMAASSVDVPVAISVYSEEGGRIAEARANGGDSLAGLLPERLTGVPRDAFSVEPIAANRRGVRMFAVALADRRVIAVALGDAVSSALVGTVVAYEAMTLAVVLAVIGYVIVRMRRVAVPRPLAAAHSAPAGAPRREADFVVETFHSVIDELQHKGRALELQSKTERARADRSELFSARIIAQMPTGLAVVDRSGRVTAANPSARELFGGLPQTRTDSVLYSEAFAETPELVSMVGECISTATAFQRREIHTGSSTPGGPRRWFGVSVSPIGEPGELPRSNSSKNLRKTSQYAPGPLFRAASS
jgi:PAS domain-containing protein